MKNLFIVIGIVVLLLTVGLSGYNEISNPLSSEEDRFIGTWESEKDGSGIVTFFSDGEWIGSGIWLGGMTGYYEIKDGKLVMSYIIEGTKFSTVNNYSFYNNDTTLTLTTPENISQFLIKQ